MTRAPAAALSLALACVLPARALAAAPAARVLTGLDVLEAEGFRPLRGLRVGVITNRTGADAAGRSIVDLLAAAPGVTLAAVFTPEHGFAAASESKKIASDKIRAGGRDIPLYSLFAGGAAGMRPQPAQLKGLDALVFDIQDAGARFYTYPATMAMALEAAKDAGVAFFVLDRPNPVGGEIVEGPLPDEDGLVGQKPTAYLPVVTRHGMTIGELALLDNATVKNPRLTVVKMRGWKRWMWYDQTGLPWIAPSPNMPDLASAVLYSGVSNLEFSNLSVGRGTPAPLSWIGAPWLDAPALARTMNAAGLAGVAFSTATFTPTKSEYEGKSCPGVRLLVTDRDAVRPLRVFAALAAALRDGQPGFDLKWSAARKLIGSKAFKAWYDRGGAPAELEKIFDRDADAFEKTRAPYLLYGPAVPLEAELGQLFTVALDTEIAARDEADIRSGRLGGALLRWDKFTGPQARDFTAMLQSWSSSAPTHLPFLISTDHEGGAVFTQPLYGGTVFPGNMALGAAGSPKLAEAAGKAAAEELRVLGIQIDFSPDVDVNTNPDNRIIGIRSFGDEPRAVAALGAAAVRGFLKGGVLPVAKHFPGHGASAENSHFDMPVIEKTARELDDVELVPFRAALKAGAPLVMPAHILFPAYETGGLPVTLSSAVIGGLLRGKLGFRGVVVSDSMDMGAITKRYGEPEAAVMALAAGCDLLELGKTDFTAVFEHVLDAVKSGRLPRERVDEAYERVKALKARFAPAPAPAAPDSPVVYPDAEKHAALAREIAERAVTVIKNDGHVLPLKLAANQKLLVLMFRSHRYVDEMREFQKQLAARHPLIDFLETSPSPDTTTVADALTRAPGADAILIGTSEWGPPSTLQRETTAKLLVMGKPVILVSLMNPYDLHNWPTAKTMLAIYGVTPAEMNALARVLFGEIRPRGRLPVDVPGVARRGDGLRRLN